MKQKKILAVALSLLLLVSSYLTYKMISSDLRVNKKEITDREMAPGHIPETGNEIPEEPDDEDLYDDTDMIEEDPIDYEKIIAAGEVADIYVYEDFIGTFTYRAKKPEGCGEYASWTLKIKKDKTFVLDYPGACAGGHGTRGNSGLTDNVLELQPTHFINYAGRSSSKDDDKLEKNSEWKQVSLTIINKNALRLQTHNQDWYNVDEVILVRIK